MQNQKDELIKLFADLMNSPKPLITIKVDCGDITAEYSYAARVAIIETNAPFCDISAFAGLGLNSLDCDGEILAAVTSHYQDRKVLFPYARIATAVHAEINDLVFIDATTDVFTADEMQTILRSHPEYEALHAADLIQNPPTTDFYNAGEQGFTL